MSTFCYEKINTICINKSYSNFYGFVTLFISDKSCINFMCCAGMLTICYSNIKCIIHRNIYELVPVLLSWDYMHQCVSNLHFGIVWVAKSNAPWVQHQEPTDFFFAYFFFIWDLLMDYLYYHLYLIFYYFLIGLS